MKRHLSELWLLSPRRGGRISSPPGGKIYFFMVNTPALECQPTSHFLTAFNFLSSSSSFSFSPAHPPSPLASPSPPSAPQWPSPTRSLERCVWETACMTKANKRTHAHTDAGCVRVRPTTHALTIPTAHKNTNRTKLMPVHNMKLKAWGLHVNETETSAEGKGTVQMFLRGFLWKGHKLLLSVVESTLKDLSLEKWSWILSRRMS